MKQPKKGSKNLKNRLNSKTTIVLLCMFLLGCSSSSSSQIWAEGKPKHHTIDGFRNYPIVPKPPSAGFAFYFRRFWGSFVFPDVPDDHYLLERDAIKQYQEKNGQDTITWLGHATFLIRVNGMTILTDPFLTDNASPFKYLGAERFVQPGISLDNLPPIDVVVISHNHLDHLDALTIESLKGKENIQVFVPLGLKHFFTERGYQFIHELDWHQRFEYKGIQFTALPAVHTSGRGLNDKNKTLWCSWAISAATGNYYFAGDTQYSPTLFKKIGKNVGPFDLALISIGAYKTIKNWPPNHLTPEEAIKVAMEIKCKVVVGMHWGTIELSDEPHFEPPVRFQKAAQENGIPTDQTWIMKIGETRLLPTGLSVDSSQTS